MPVWMSRGYTGHEHLREFDLINMNGRMYDPAIGRMLAPDNFVQDPYNTQSYNRYAYVFNSPLSYTDPSGEIAGWAVSLIATAASYLINAGVNQSWNPNEWSSGMVGFGVGYGGGGGYMVGGGNIGGNYSVMAGGGGNGNYQYGFQAGPGLAGTSQVQPAGTVNINMNTVNSRANWRPMHMGGPSNQDYIAWLTDDSDMSGATAGGGVGDPPGDYPVVIRRNPLEPRTLNSAGAVAGYFSGGLGLGQMGMLDYRRSLSIHQRVNTSATFYPAYRGLGIASKTLGRAGNLGSGIGFYLDTRSFATGEISLGRYAYRTGGLGLSVGLGAAVGGPPGAAVGASIGGIWSGAEYIYDTMLVPLWNQTIYQIGNFERAIKNGWYPGR
jgi:RHS repeat-associated protein